MYFDKTIVNWVILNMNTGWFKIALEMRLYRVIGIQFKENKSIGFGGNEYPVYQEKIYPYSTCTLNCHT